MFKKLRNKLLLLNMTIITVVMAAAFTVIYAIMYTNVRSADSARLAAVRAYPVQSAINSRYITVQPDESSMTITALPVDYNLSFIIVADTDGTMLEVRSFIGMPESAYRDALSRALGMGKQSGSISLEGRKWLFEIATIAAMNVIQGAEGTQAFLINDRTQISFLDITESSRTLTALLLTFIAVGLAMLFIIFGISFYFASGSIRPIEEYWRKQKQFVADASHELKTPLAIIDANVDALLLCGERPAEDVKWIAYIKSESERMGKLVRDMLYLARAEDTEQVADFDLSGAVSDAAVSMETVIYERGITLNEAIEPGVTVLCDGEKIQQAILILLDNALKYSEPGGRVDITLVRRKNHAVVTVGNSGATIPESELPKIFDRFYRGDSSHSHDTPGFGLGLAIAKAGVERSGGTLTADSSDGYTSFEFKLKLT